MSISISNTGYFNIPADTLLDVPSGDFSWCFWVRSTKADANAHMVIDQYDNTNDEGMRFWLNPDETMWFSVDVGTYTSIGTVASVSDGADYLFVGQRDGTDINIKYASVGDTSVTTATTSIGSTGGVAVTNGMNFLADAQLSASQYAVDEDIGEIAKVHRVITDEEILAIANGASVPTVLGNDLIVYFPATEYQSGGVSDIVGGLFATAKDIPTLNPQSVITDTDGTTTTLSSYVVPAGDNKILTIVASCEGTGGPVVSSVTHNGVNLTYRDSITISSLNTAEIWDLQLGSTTPTGDIVVTWDSTCSAHGIGAVTVRDVEQQAPEVTNTGTASADTVNTAITTVTNNAVIVDGFAFGTSNASSVTQGPSQVEDISVTVGGSTLGLGVSHNVTGFLGSSTLGWTNNAVFALRFAHVLVAYENANTDHATAEHFPVTSGTFGAKPSGTPPVVSSPPQLALLGVG